MAYMVISIAPLVCHQKYLVCHSAQAAVIDTLIENARLVGGNLRGKRDADGQAVLVSAVDKSGDESGVCVPVLCGNKLKVHIDSGIVHGIGSEKQVINQRFLNFRAVDQNGYQITVE